MKRLRSFSRACPDRPAELAPSSSPRTPTVDEAVAHYRHSLASLMRALDREVSHLRARWTWWLEAAGPSAPMQPEGEISFESSMMAIQAALDGFRRVRPPSAMRNPSTPRGEKVVRVYAARTARTRPPAARSQRTARCAGSSSRRPKCMAPDWPALRDQWWLRGSATAPGSTRGSIGRASRRGASAPVALTDSSVVSPKSC